MDGSPKAGIVIRPSLPHVSYIAQPGCDYSGRSGEGGF